MNKTKIPYLRMPAEGDEPETVIIANGEYPAEGSIARKLLDKCNRVVCCDGAANTYVANGGIPAAIVGDCDSLDENIRIQYVQCTFRTTEQLSNDLTKAVMHCLSNGWNNLTILGATGKREDHTLGNISLLCDYAQLADVRMITNYGVLNAISSDTELETFAGQQLSFFTPDPQTAIHVSNVIYEIPESRLTSWWCGTLNEATANKIKVSCGGRVLIFREF